MAQRCHWCGGVADPLATCPHDGAPPDYIRPRRPVRVVVPSPVPSLEGRPGRPAEVDLVRRYLTWHATAVCDGTCALCREAIAWLRAHGGVPIGILVLTDSVAARTNGSS